MDIRQSSLTMNSLQPAATQSKQVLSLSANTHSVNSSSAKPASINAAAINHQQSVNPGLSATTAAITKSAVLSSPNVNLTSTTVAAISKVTPAATTSVSTSSSSNISQSNRFNLRTGASQIGGFNPGQIANLSGARAGTSPSLTALTEASFTPTSTNNAINSEPNSLSDATAVANPFQSGSPSLDDANDAAVEERVNPFEDTSLADDATQQDELSPAIQEVTKEAEPEKQQVVQPQFSQINQQSDAEKAAEQAEKQVKAQQQKAIQAEQQIINELSKRDTEVKTHEQAHKAIGGMFAQSPSFSYEKGPDGKRYAVDGEVQIDVGVIKGDPQATFNKMQKVYAAAMAPNQPSSADIRVAAEAVQKMNQAKAEMAEQRQEKIVPAEDIQYINELANIYKQANVEQNGFQESQLTPFTLPDDNASKPKVTLAAKNEGAELSNPASRFIEKMNESVDTQSPQMPSATLAYFKNQQPEPTNNLSTLAFSV